jgi:hypothetical protein
MTTNSIRKIIFYKNHCYDKKLELLKKTQLYDEVMSAFRDTFQVLKTKKEYFGVREDVVTNQIDEAIFFKRDSSECMLLVLQKLASDRNFAKARTVRGYHKENKWHFEVSMVFIFEKDYFELFKENSFENISKAGRHSILTIIHERRRGCKIDDKFWFVKD